MILMKIKLENERKNNHKGKLLKNALEKERNKKGTKIKRNKNKKEQK